MSTSRLKPLKDLRRQEEDEAKARLSVAVAALERAEDEAAARRLKAEEARARYVAARAAPHAGERKRASAAELGAERLYLERLLIELGRAEHDAAAFAGGELERARRAEQAAAAECRRSHAERKGLDRHAATLADAARRLTARRQED